MSDAFAVCSEVVRELATKVQTAKCNCDTVVTTKLESNVPRIPDLRGIFMPLGTRRMCVFDITFSGRTLAIDFSGLSSPLIGFRSSSQHGRNSVRKEAYRFTAETGLRWLVRIRTFAVVGTQF